MPILRYFLYVIYIYLRVITQIRAFTRRTLRHLTEPEKKTFYSRIGTEVSRQVVLGALAGWEGDETTKGLAFQVLYDLIRESDDTPSLVPSPCYDERGSADLHLTKTGGAIRGPRRGPRITTRAQGLLYRLEMETHAIERAIATLYNHSSQHHIAQSTGIKILQTLTHEGYLLSEKTPMDRSQ